MEPKKNPKIDVHRKRNMIFNLSLVLSLMVVITAFNWSSPIPPEVVIDPGPSGYDSIPFVLPTDFRTVPEKPKPDVDLKKTIANPAFIEVKELLKETAAQPIVEATSNSSSKNVVVIEIVEDPDTVITDFFKVQTPPEPVGGYEQFYKTLQENLEYPRRAIQRGIEGKVFIQFTVDKTGELINLKVLRGLSKECDAESLRIMSLTKWSPGKQRGKPVRVRMVLPVTFKMG
jgi:periplasmic protein TonB